MKECPFCVKQIEDDAIRCRHCGKVVDAQLRGPGGSAAGARPDEDVRDQIRSGNKIAAITLVRERSSLGLKEAKDYVEAIERGENPPPPPAGTGAKAGGCGKAVLLLTGAAILAFFVLHALTDATLK